MLVILPCSSLEKKFRSLADILFRRIHNRFRLQLIVYSFAFVQHLARTSTKVGKIYVFIGKILF